MSSHHFVREGQEPALLIIDALSMELAAPLLEWAPHVVVVDAALEEVMLWGIKIDFVLLADESFLPLMERLQTQQPSQTYPYSPEHALLAGIEVLRQHQNSAVTVMAEEALSLMKLPEASLFPVSFLTRELRWSLIEKGHFEKWLPSGTVVRIIPETPDRFEILGLEYSNSGYRAVRDGLVSVKSPEQFWIGEYL